MALRTRQHFALTFSVLVAGVAPTMTTSASCNVTPRLDRSLRHRGMRVGTATLLVEVIVSTIAPDTWDDVGGQVSIQVVDAWGVAGFRPPTMFTRKIRRSAPSDATRRSVNSRTDSLVWRKTPRS